MIYRPHIHEEHDRYGGYDVYHPTKGWRRVSGARVRAAVRMAEMLSAGKAIGRVGA